MDPAGADHRDARFHSEPHDREWVIEAIACIEADLRRSADTHLVTFPLPPAWGIDLYLKDESTHPTGSLKHRLARSLFLYGLCNGWIGEGVTIIEASSGSTAVSEAYFARMLGLPFVAVVPASISPEKVALIEQCGGSCHVVEDASAIYAEAARLADAVRRRVPRSVHLCRAGDGLARQQQHRRIDLRADGPRAPPRAGLGRGRCRHRWHRGDDRSLHPLLPGRDQALRRRPTGKCVRRLLRLG